MSRRTKEHDALTAFHQWDVIRYTDLELQTTDQGYYVLVNPTDDRPTPRWNFTDLQYIMIRRLRSRNPLIPTVRYQVKMLTTRRHRAQFHTADFRHPADAIEEVKALILSFRTGYTTHTPEAHDL